MGKLKECTWSETYQYTIASDDNPEPIEFYMEGLLNSNKLHLLLGYFSSSAISLLAPGFAYFISNGGELTMIINQFLSSKDKEAFERGLEGKIEKAFDLTDVSSLENTLNKYDVHFFQCLAYLISEKRIRFQIIRPKMGNGISHYKQGIFYDGENKVGFSGSCNFTSYGFLHNRENLNVYLGWEEGYPKTWINTNERLFEKYVKQEDEKVEYLPLEKIEIAIKEKFGGNLDIQGLLSQEEDLIKEKLGLTTNPEIHKVFEKASKKIKEKMVNQTELESKTPKFPYPEGPRPYQVEAYQNWVANDYKGLFAMATGTGKTLTSAFCLIEQFKINKLQRNIIVVPGKELVEQWEEELMNCNFKTPIKWFSENKKLKEDKRYIELLLNSDKSEFNIIITYDSFQSKKFISIFKEKFNKIIVIFDEAHNMGAPNFKETIKEIEFDKVIGLSATPLRMWDENNENDFIERFFNTKHPNYTYTYSMSEAIKNGYLCRYKYYIEFVYFTDEKWNEYVELSRKIYFEEGKKKSQATTINLLKRQFLKDRAENKLDATVKIVKQLYNEKNYKNTLIYCPKGLNDEEEIIIFELQRLLNKSIGSLNVQTFLGITKDRDLLIKDFENEEVDILLAIKCLDEGVNIPKTINAIFVASGQNYREYIQRRGRVLRKYEREGFKKEFANIFDIIILPSPEQYFKNQNVGENLILSEFKRIYEFYNLSEKELNVYKKIKEQLELYGLTEEYIRIKVNEKYN